MEKELSLHERIRAAISEHYVGHKEYTPHPQDVKIILTRAPLAEFLMYIQPSTPWKVLEYWGHHLFYNWDEEQDGPVPNTNIIRKCASFYEFPDGGYSLEAPPELRKAILLIEPDAQFRK